MCSITAPIPERERDKGVGDEELDETGGRKTFYEGHGLSRAVASYSDEGFSPWGQSFNVRKSVPQRLKPGCEHGLLRHG